MSIIGLSGKKYAYASMLPLPSEFLKHIADNLSFVNNIFPISLCVGGFE